MWYGEVVQLGSDRYHDLQADGWEPTNFILLPDPRARWSQPAPGGLATLNGGGLTQSFVTMVGMRKWVKKSKARG